MGCWNVGEMADDLRVFFTAKSETIEYRNFPGSTRYSLWKRFLVCGFCLCFTIAVLVSLRFLIPIPAKCEVPEQTGNDTVTSEPEAFPSDWDFTDMSGQPCSPTTSTTYRPTPEFPWEATPLPLQHKPLETLIVDCPSYNDAFPLVKEPPKISDYQDGIISHLRNISQLVHGNKSQVPKNIWLHLTKLDLIETEFCVDYAAIKNHAYYGTKFLGIVVGSKWWSELEYKFGGYHEKLRSTNIVKMALFQKYLLKNEQKFVFMLNPSNCFKLKSTHFDLLVKNFDNIVYWQEENRPYLREKDNGEQDCVDFNVFEECKKYIQRNFGVKMQSGEMKQVGYFSFEQFLQEFSTDS